MPSIAVHLANWLATRPGPIRASSQTDCYAAAFQLSNVKGATLEFFTDSLIRAGYEAKQWPIHNTKGEPDYWLLALPEKQAGSRL